MGAILTAPLAFIVHRIFGRSGDHLQEESDIYQYKGVIHAVKKLVTLLILKLTFRKRRFDLHAENADELLKSGIIPSDAEWQIELPQDAVTLLHHSDGVSFCATNSMREFLRVHLFRLWNNQAEVMIYLRLSSGCAYTLPNECVIVNASETNSFEASGLRIECLNPMRRWRVSFNGALREVSSEQGDVTPKIVHVKFGFIWSALSSPYDLKSDLHLPHVASVLSVETLVHIITQFARFQRAMDGYEQTGHLFGTVRVGRNEEQEVHLWGIRTRLHGELEIDQPYSFGHCYGVTKDGLQFHIGTLSVLDLVTNYQFGFVNQADGFQHEVRSVWPSLDDSGQLDSLQSEASFFFTTENKDYDLKIKLQGLCCTYNTSCSWPAKIDARAITFTLNGEDGQGMILFGHGEPDEKCRRQSAVNILPTLGCMLDKMPLVTTFHENFCQDPNVSGGKGASLAKLSALSRKSRKFTVPEGVVLTTKAYHMFMDNRQLEEIIQSLEDMAWGRKTGSLEDECQRTVVALEKSPIPASLRDSIVQKMGEVFRETVGTMCFAVRSSALGEDSGDLSAAGQMNSYLGIRSIDQVLEAIKRCWASQFSHVAVKYKRWHGQLINSPMAVVIQEMVPSEKAGVAFTCDPLTGNPLFITITANYGLGESVVSSSAEPDTVVLGRPLSGDFSIHSRTVGTKKVSVVLEGSGGTKEVETRTEMSSEICITDDEAKFLGEVSVEIEKYFGGPRDLEWAFYEKTLFLLQARPVTRLHAESAVEIMRELDTGIRCEEEILSKANVGEVIPGALSFLGTFVMSKVTYVAYQDVYKDFLENYAPCLYTFRCYALSYNHYLLNLIDQVIQLKDTKSSTFSQANAIAYFGRLIDTDEITRRNSARHAKTKNWRKGILMPLKLFPQLLTVEVNLDDRWKQFSDFQVTVHHLPNALSVYEEIQRQWPRYYEPLMCLGKATGLSTLYNIVLLTNLTAARGGWCNEVFTDFAYLLGKCTGVDSADIPRSLQELAAEISRCTNAYHFRAMTAEEALHWLQTADNKACIKFRKFLVEHGHRCVKEFDLYSVTWGSNPLPVVKTLQAMVGSVSLVQPQRRGTPTEVLNSLDVSFSFMQMMLLKFILPRCWNGVGMREKAKSLLIKVLNSYRNAYQHLAGRLVSEGYIPDADLMYYLTHEEIGQVLKTRSPRLISKAHQRRRLYPAMNAVILPEIIKGVPKMVKRKVSFCDSASKALKGTPVCHGVVKGTARVVLRLEDASSLQKGDILITYSTDVGWSPFFPLLGGLVTEIGGLISHGAVVAREYGLPCVIAVCGATSFFHTGETVLLDGGRGVVQKANIPKTT